MPEAISLPLIHLRTEASSSPNCHFDDCCGTDAHNCAAGVAIVDASRRRVAARGIQKNCQYSSALRFACPYLRQVIRQRWALVERTLEKRNDAALCPTGDCMQKSPALIALNTLTSRLAPIK